MREWVKLFSLLSVNSVSHDAPLHCSMSHVTLWEQQISALCLFLFRTLTSNSWSDLTSDAEGNPVSPPHHTFFFTSSLHLYFAFFFPSALCAAVSLWQWHHQAVLIRLLTPVLVVTLLLFITHILTKSTKSGRGKKMDSYCESGMLLFWSHSECCVCVCVCVCVSQTYC